MAHLSRHPKKKTKRKCYGLHLEEVKTGRKAGRLVVVGCWKTEGWGKRSLVSCYTVTVGRYYYKHRRGLLYSRIQMNNVIACVKNQVLPSIMACHDGNYIGESTYAE